MEICCCCCEKPCFNFPSCFYVSCTSQSGACLILKKKCESPLSEDLLSQVWLLLTERFWTTSISLYYFSSEQSWLKKKENSVLTQNALCQIWMKWQNESVKRNFLGKAINSVFTVLLIITLYKRDFPSIWTKIWIPLIHWCFVISLIGLICWKKKITYRQTGIGALGLDKLKMNSVLYTLQKSNYPRYTLKLPGWILHTNVIFRLDEM